jgi:hypothetical protein
MPTAIYRFTRGSDTKEGKLSAFFSQNRASTDALSVLIKWCSDAPNRHCETVKDVDEELVATLSWSESDHQAGRRLRYIANELASYVTLSSRTKENTV